MAEFVMPALGADMNAGTLIRWLKQPGDRVERGDIIAEVHTDKSDIEVEAFDTGVIEKLLVDPGVEVPVGTPLALISAAPGSKAGDRPHAPRRTQGADHRIIASPAARKLAAECGVDLADVHGSGPGGRIQRRDVEHAAQSPGAAEPSPVPPEPTAPAPPQQAPAPLPGEDRRAAMRRAIAVAMSRSKREVPHFYLGETIDLSETMRWLAEENRRRSVQERLLAGVLLLKATALALHEVPELNATWHADEAVHNDRIHLGVAVFLRGGGLVAPALHDADIRSIDDLMHDFRDLVGRARAGRLRSSEVADPTITVTSLGERGAESVVPIIFPPQVAIVGFGRIVERPWVSAGQVLPCPTVAATLAADHRVTDGHRAGAFLEEIARLLQQPEEL